MTARLAVLVTDGEERAALAAVRSLGAAGHRVIVASPARRPLAGASRYCSSIRFVPSPSAMPEQYASAIAHAAAEAAIDVLLPITEPSLLALLPHRSCFHDVVLPFVPAERFRDVCDKRLVLSLAASLGLAVPRELTITAAAHGRTALDAWTAFPAVVKPARSVVVVPGGGLSKQSVGYARDHAQLLERIETLPAEAFPVIVQQRVVGPGIGLFVLLWEGELRAAFSHRRLREKPPTGGVSVLSESIPLDDDLLADSVGLLQRLDWQGVAMVEYKQELASGTRFVMEVNGRFWGSLQLAIDAGVDFPNLLLAAATGRRLPCVRSYRVGVRNRWTLGHLDHVLARFRGAATRLDGGSPLADGCRALIDFARYTGPAARGEVLRLSDPWPAFRELASWLRGR